MLAASEGSLRSARFVFLGNFPPPFKRHNYVFPQLWSHLVVFKWLRVHKHQALCFFSSHHQTSSHLSFISSTALPDSLGVRLCGWTGVGTYVYVSVLAAWLNICLWIFYLWTNSRPLWGPQWTTVCLLVLRIRFGGTGTCFLHFHPFKNKLKRSYWLVENRKCGAGVTLHYITWVKSNLTWATWCVITPLAGCGWNLHNVGFKRNKEVRFIFTVWPLHCDSGIKSSSHNANVTPTSARCTLAIFWKTFWLSWDKLRQKKIETSVLTLMGIWRGLFELLHCFHKYFLLVNRRLSEASGYGHEGLCSSFMQTIADSVCYMSTIYADFSLKGQFNILSHSLIAIIPDFTFKVGTFPLITSVWCFAIQWAGMNLPTVPLRLY